MTVCRAPGRPNRFAAPRPAEPWDGVRDASRFGSPPPQPGRRAGDVELRGGDWLTLAVWTPDPGRRGGLPVVVWISGGAYLHCDSANPHLAGTALAAAGAVVVSGHYRTGVDGFARLDGAPDNRYRAAFPSASPNALRETAMADWLMRMPTLHLAEAAHAGGARAWLYELCWGFGRHGASHALDTLLVFGTADVTASHRSRAGRRCPGRSACRADASRAPRLRRHGRSRLVPVSPLRPSHPGVRRRVHGRALSRGTLAQAPAR